MFKKGKKIDGKESEEMDPYEQIVEEYLEERGIANIELMASDLGLPISLARHTLDRLIDANKVHGMFIFDNKEFVMLEGIENDIISSSEGTFKYNISELIRKYGIPLAELKGVILNLISQGRLYGFFDDPGSATFYRLTADEDEALIGEINKQKLNLLSFSDNIDDLVLKHEEIDLTALIENASKDKAVESEDDFTAMAEEVIKETKKKQSVRSILEYLISTKRIKGNFTKDYEYFISDHIVLKELLNLIKFSKEVTFTDIEEELGIVSPETIKTYIGIIEKNYKIQGYYSQTESYITRELVEETILEKTQGRDEVQLSSLKDMIKLDDEITHRIFNDLIREKKLSGSLNADQTKFFSLSKIKNVIFDPLSQAKEIQLEDLNTELQLAKSDLVRIVESLISAYQKQLRGFLTKNKDTFITEETLSYRLMEILNAQEKISLKKVAEMMQISSESVREIVDNILNIGLVSGTIKKDQFIRKK